jgi:hypothetical protein
VTNRAEHKKVHGDKGPPQEIEFSVVDADLGCGKPMTLKSTGTLIDVDLVSIGLLTQLPLQPGHIVTINQGGTTKKGIVMWSVESSDNFRIQVRFL